MNALRTNHVRSAGKADAADHMPLQPDLQPVQEATRMV